MAFKNFKGCDGLTSTKEEPKTELPKKNEKEGISIELIDYSEKEFHEKHVDKIEDCLPFKDKKSVTWININGVHDKELNEKVGKLFNLHFLTVRDISNTSRRPKVEQFDDYLYLVLKMFYLKKGKLVTEQVSLMLGQNFVISFQERKGDVFNQIREDIKASKGKIRTSGADYLIYSLVSALVDNYFIILENFGDRIENLQERLVKNPSSNILQTIHEIKREVMFLRRSIWPLREVVNEVGRDGMPLITKALVPYLRDLYDHTIQAIDIAESFRDSLSDMLDIYLSSVSNKTNEIMKVLTMFSTIFIPLTFIAGIYGMNFKNMPELSWKWGYPVSLMVMGGIMVFMLIYFKRKKWL